MSIRRTAVNFGSNFQPFIRKRDVRHNDDAHLTRQPEDGAGVSRHLGTGAAQLSHLFARYISAFRELPRPAVVSSSRSPTKICTTFANCSMKFSALKILWL